MLGYVIVLPAVLQRSGYATVLVRFCDLFHTAVDFKWVAGIVHGPCLGYPVTLPTDHIRVPKVAVTGEEVNMRNGGNRRLLKMVSLVVSLAMSQSGWSQTQGADKNVLDLSLEELTRLEIPTVVGAAKYEQTQLQAPSSVTVITADEIRRYGYTTLADILRSVRGFYVTNNRNYSFVGTRGFNRPGDYNSRVLVMIDGHRINDNVYGQGSVGGEFALDVDLIDRVEIIRGPGSALYGTGAFFGVVNVIPKRGRDIGGFEVAAGAGKSETWQGRLTYGKKYDNGVDVLLSVNGFDTKGQKRLRFPEFAGNAALNDGYALGADSERWNNAYGSLQYGGFKLQVAAVARKKVLPSGIFDTIFGDAGNYTWDQHRHVDLQYQHDFSKDSNLHLRLYADRYKYYADYVYEVPPRVLNKDYGTANWWGSEVRFTTHFVDKHRVTLGAEFVNNKKSDQVNYDVDPFTLYNHAPYQYKTWALYLQDEIALTDQLTLTLGVRTDRQYEGITSTNPRFALVYLPWPTTAFKALHGTAFRAANSFERFIQTPTQTQSPNLKPEEIRTTEFVVEHNFRSNLRGVFSIYRYHLDKLVTQVTDPLTGVEHFENGQRVNAKGFDVEFQAKFRPVEGRVSYSRQEARDTATGLILSNSPKHMAKLNLIAPLPNTAFSAAWETQYLSKRTSWENLEVPAYAVSNLTFLARNLAKGLDVTAGVYNVFDKRYGDPASNDDASGLLSIPQDRRSFRIRAYYKF